MDRNPTPDEVLDAESACVKVNHHHTHIHLLYIHKNDKAMMRVRYELECHVYTMFPSDFSPSWLHGKKITG
jgi:hypothetical protein